MTRKLGIVSVLVVLLAAPQGLWASNWTPVQIFERPDKFDDKAVTLVGTVSVAGMFQKVKRVSGRRFYNEVKRAKCPVGELGARGSLAGRLLAVVAGEFDAYAERLLVASRCARPPEAWKRRLARVSAGVGRGLSAEADILCQADIEKWRSLREVEHTRIQRGIA